MKTILEDKEKEFTSTSQIWTKLRKYQKLRNQFLIIAICSALAGIIALAFKAQGWCLFGFGLEVGFLLPSYLANMKADECVKKLQAFIAECNGKPGT